MNDLGLYVDFDGRKNIVIDGDVTEYAVGEMICELARIAPTDIKKYVTGNSHYFDTDPKATIGDAIIELHDSLRKDYGVVVSCIITTDFSNEISDCFSANKEALQLHIEQMNSDKMGEELRAFIFEDTEFSGFGISTVGHALLTAYYGFAYQFILFMHMFHTLVTDGTEDD